MTDNGERARIIEEFLADPVLCHSVLFEHRHPQKTPEFHKEMIRGWWSDTLRYGDEAFRGAAKSTIAEDAICAMACVRFFKYCLIIGNTERSAVDRLSAIKHEIEFNEKLIQIFGTLKGPTWNEAEVLLSNGVLITAKGAGQTIRGTKHWEQRPDILFVDDLEDEENVSSPDARAKLKRWFWRSLIPACEPNAKIRIVGTPLDPDSLLESVRRDSGWEFHVYPIVVPAVTDPKLWEYSNWEDRFPLSKIRQIRDESERVGDLQGFVQEYLCQSEEPRLKAFQRSRIVRVDHFPDWAPTLVAVDPARTAVVGKSARTGYVAVSSVGSKLYVRSAYGEYHQPAEIVLETFKLDRMFNPIRVGIEKDGLEEFLMQPLRQEALKSGQPIPLVPLNAPRDRNKISFISGLQPFVESGEIVMCGEFKQLFDEMEGFPRGLKDILNALAYIPQMRGGRPVYEDFGLIHVAPSLVVDYRRPVYLTLSCRPGYTAGALVQYLNGAIRIYADWLREGDVTAALEQMIPEARVIAGREVEIVTPGSQLDRFNNTGLPSAISRLRLRPTRIPWKDTLGSLRPFLQRQSLHQPAFMASRAARWTINGLALGYSYGLDGGASLNRMPENDYYAALFEGIEGLAKWLTIRPDVEDNDEIRYAYTREGHRYQTSRPGLTNARSSDFKR